LVGVMTQPLTGITLHPVDEKQPPCLKS
jgi:hypothetical protein